MNTVHEETEEVRALRASVADMGDVLAALRDQRADLYAVLTLNVLGMLDGGAPRSIRLDPSTAAEHLERVLGRHKGRLPTGAELRQLMDWQGGLRSEIARLAGAADARLPRSEPEASP